MSGQPVAIQLNAQGKSGIGYATGTATIVLDDAVNLGTYPLNQSGSGWVPVDSITHTGLQVGSHSFKVIYNGDSSLDLPSPNQLESLSAGLAERLWRSLPRDSHLRYASTCAVCRGIAGESAAHGTIDVYDNNKRIATQIPLTYDGLFGSGLAQVSYVVRAQPKSNGTHSCRTELPDRPSCRHRPRSDRQSASWTLERENSVEAPVPQQEKVSTTDPDSTYATKGGPARLGYYDNYLVDNASCVIVGVQWRNAQRPLTVVEVQLL